MPGIISKDLAKRVGSKHFGLSTLLTLYFLLFSIYYFLFTIYFFLNCLLLTIVMSL